MYTVKNAAALLGLSEHAVRFYTDHGLIPTVQRDKNNKRLFDERAMKGLSSVKCLKKSGLSIKEIKHYIDLCAEGDSTVPERYQIIWAQREIAKIQLEEARKQLEYLDFKTKLYEDMMAARHLSDEQK